MQLCSRSRMVSATTIRVDGSIRARLTSPSAKKECASMNTPSELTIVIPAKNEAKLIPRLLTSLLNQDYQKMRNTKVLLADASSTDGTPDIVMSFRDRLDVRVIPGGLPSVGRNAGAALADTRYILFIDADIEPASPSLIQRAIELAQRKNLHCVTTNIICRGGGTMDNLRSEERRVGKECRSRWSTVD